MDNLSTKDFNHIAHFLAQKATKSFKTPKPLPKICPTRIKVNGEFIRLSSGKTLWKRIGDAKSALRLHVENEFSNLVGWNNSFGTRHIKDLNYDITHEDARKLCEALVQKLYNSVEFVQVEG